MTNQDGQNQNDYGDGDNQCTLVINAECSYRERFNAGGHMIYNAIPN
jgi:hypothetical protein